MTFSCDGFLDVANSLINYSPLEEKHIRSAINRAYYSAFIEARDRAIVLNLITPYEQKDIHFKVRKAFKNKGELLISDMLKGLSKLRNDADYDMNKSLKIMNAQNAIYLANTIKGKVKHV